MKLTALAAVLALLPGAAFASLGTAPSDAAPAEASQGAVTEAKNALLNEIEAWRGTQLRHTDPPAPLTAKFEPRLNEIKAAVRAAATEAELAKPKKDLDAWKHDLLEAKFARARKQGLEHGGIAAFSQEQRQQAAFSAALHAAVAQDAAQRGFGAASRRAAAGALNPNGFFDGARLGSGGAESSVFAGAPADVNDPARYSKVRQILISQGASARVVDMAIKEAIRQHADPLLVLAVINQESGFRTHATSAVGARGLMQLMPDTGRGLGVRNAGMLYDAQTNLRAGIAFLKSLWGQFVGGDMQGIESVNPWASHSVKAAVAAYNAGPGAVRRYSGVPPYRQTQGYVKSVIGYYERFKQYLAA
ncbi:MAG TPA: lytic transglycosylase domain-containing protein [Elusimicrobiota bacterium]|nr:lytic transglycosylase domain-containing protein [Elusimicrobiota bacterium]